MNAIKRFVVLSFLAVAVLFSNTGCSTVVEPGYEGIKVVNTGAKRGVDTTAATTGRIWFGFQEHVETYPISWQNYVFTASSNEGNKLDESLSFNALGGAQITADVGIVYRVRPGVSPRFYLEYNKTMEQFLHGIMRNELRDAINREASKVPPTELLSTGKAGVLDRAKADLQNGPLGKYLEFQTVSFVHSLRPDKQIMESINNVIAATNNAQAEVQKALGMAAAARGDSAASVIKAKGRAEANDLLNKSLTAGVLQWEWMQRWDGAVQKVGGSNSSLIQIPGDMLQSSPRTPKK